MRCPKCNYISFDNQDICNKCRKPIKIIEELDGVIFAAQPPLFLDLNNDSSRGIADNDVVDLDGIIDSETIVEISMDGDENHDIEEIEIDFGKEDDQGFSLELDGDESDIEEIDLSEDESIDGTISFDSTSVEENSQEDQDERDVLLGFKDIDISDLASPEGESPGHDISDNVDIDLANPDTRAPSEPRAGLDDLLIDGLDLDASSPPVAGSKSYHIARPSLKTGTALDDFQVDLGELVAEER